LHPQFGLNGSKQPFAILAVHPFDALYELPACAWGVIPFVLAQMPAAAVGNSAAAESVSYQVVWRSFSRSARRARRSS